MQAWTPLDPDKAKRLLDGGGFRWWLNGGWAIDTFLGRQTRDHGDIDVAVLRCDLAEVDRWLGSWDIHLASAGTLSPWNREPVPAEAGNDLWCRPGGSYAWALQLNLLDSDGGQWLFRRNRQITLPISNLGRQSNTGVPYIAPQIVLLFKAKNPRPRDEEDFASVLPLLDHRAKEWLATSIEATYGDHPWRERLSKGIRHGADDK